ncbi:MAG TPA: metalloregulator ArsR/SmtB family transcription factor [Candidatus Saccharimonadia bacterium]|nr:metalloregulator ArsR/SmtB family transcription factor [Candidatus Saccharimonadia bacterium]
MVECVLDLDAVFGSLAHPTRRDILSRLALGELTIGEIAKPYSLTFAAVSKHLMVLEKARLVIKRRKGKEQIARLSPRTLADAEAYFAQYQKLWEDHLDALETLLDREQHKQERTD